MESFIYGGSFSHILDLQWGKFLQTIPHPLLLGLVDQSKEKGEEREVNVAFSSLCLQRFKFTPLPLGCHLENRVGMGWGHRAPKGPCSRQSSFFNLMRYRNLDVVQIDIIQRYLSLAVIHQ